MSGEEMLKTTTGVFEKLLTANTVMGTPVEFDSKVVIPIASFGFGFGGGEAPSPGNTSGGAGSGGGAGMSPVALLILHKDVSGREGVQILSLQKMNPLTEVISESIPKIADAIPKMMDAMQSRKSPPPQ
ncbi:MAG: sporulation protein [Methanomicrobiales archaeon]|nr:sporulation protein [Methanomicrobiales archaeon]